MTAIRVSEVLLGLAEFLHDEGVAVWRPTTGYLAAERAITIKELPAAPDAAVALSAYGVTDDVVLPDVEVRVQLRFRSGGSRTAVDDFADDAFDVLHGRHGFTLGTLRVHQARRLSSLPLGADDNRRHERADNYGLILMRP
jgi:hypothetical protein